MVVCELWERRGREGRLEKMFGAFEGEGAGGGGRRYGRFLFEAALVYDLEG